MERAPKIKLDEKEKKTHEIADRRRRILDAAAGEKAVADLNEFLAKEGITEEEWKKQTEMRRRRKEGG